ncbi:hypothetical protein IFR04_001587 [Cadophora malorum]|uniref:DNA/RNA-binding protein Alba-like domain-containing protein n=1 Tax=Cadophora malorum TaxID=108018 RepID=A0A8H7WHY8_9HELO|nr:hypothetical protein IFR04_001587 [Cadophora malorum]
MAHTKAKARRGPDGHAFRENAKKKTAGSQVESGSAVSGGGNGKRKRNRERDGSKNGDKSHADAENDAKRRKETHDAVEESSIDVSGEQDGIIAAPKGSETQSKSRSETALLVPVVPGLETTHKVTTMSIISSSNINKKVSRILELLSEEPGGGGDGEGKGREGEGKRRAVVMLYAKAPVVSKVVSVAEIAKREIAREGGKWFTYCVVGEVMGEQIEKEKSGEKKDQRKEVGSEAREDEDQMEGGEGEEEAFELMKTPFERALEVEGKPKVRAMPVMSLYLSRVRLDALRVMYGEQTNAQEVK